MQSSLHSKESIKSEIEHVATHCLLSNRNENQPLAWFCTEKSTKLIHLNRKVRDSAQRRLSLDHTW